MTRRLLPLLLALLLLVLPPLTTASRAYVVPVVDFINWIENALQVVQQYLEIVQRYEVLYRQYLQYATMLKNLEHTELDDWSDLVSLYYSLDGILHQTYSLGYTVADIATQMNETFPGVLPPADYYAAINARNHYLQVADRARRTLTTMNAVIQVAGRISWNNQPSQMHLQRIQDRVTAADGALKISQATAELESLNADTLGKILQTNLLTANAAVVANSYQVQKDAAETAAIQAWLAEPYPDYAPDDPRFARYSGVPNNWPWPCFGCR